MAGIGKYTKGKKFELKSGNNPAFKMMGNPEAGDSPITKDFGIGEGTSPYVKDDDDDDGNGKGKGWKKAATIALAGLTSGLDAVYGSGKIMPSVKFADDDDDDKKETPGQKLLREEQEAKEAAKKSKNGN